MPFDGRLYEDPVLRVLCAAQERIRAPERWCKSDLKKIAPDGTKQWCARGATLAESDWEWYDKTRRAADTLLNHAAAEMGYFDVPGHYLVSLNNCTDHPTVMAMFDRAQELRVAELNEAVLA